MDSAVNLALSTDAGETRLLVEVEIEGFSQKYQRTVNVGPEITYLMIKPPAMSGLTSLGSGRETQITLRVTQMDTGELLVAESKTITLHSIYDFTMLNSEFGVIEPYNLLAWLRPDAVEVWRCGARPSTGWKPTLARVTVPCPAISSPIRTVPTSHLPPYCRPWPYKVRSAILACAITWDRIPLAAHSAC